MKQNKFSIETIILLLFTNSFAKSLPIVNSAMQTSVDIYNENFELPYVHLETVNNERVNTKFQEQETVSENSEINTENSTTVLTKVERNIARNQLQPGQYVRNYNVQITIDGGLFRGRAMLEVRSEFSEGPLQFYVDGLSIISVMLGRINDDTGIIVEATVDQGILKIDKNGQPSNLHLVIIEYTGVIRNDGTGIFMGHFNNQMYLGMNLYPTHAKRVFPCIDELTEIVPATFTFNKVDFPHMVFNSMIADNSVTEFRTLPLPLHLWAMVAHNLPSFISASSENLILYGRTLQNQHVYSLEAIGFIFDNLNKWTGKNYCEVIVNQNGIMNVFALSDTSVPWHGLSTVSIWEPYVYMETTHSFAHRHTALVKMGAALAGQWFGFVIYPQNWRHQWVIAGLQLYSAYDILRQFQSDPYGLDITLLDFNTLFVTDVIQEGLLRDAYLISEPLLLADDIFDEPQIRKFINGVLKYKAPALLWMVKNILGETDHVQRAAQSLLNHWSLEPVTTFEFINMIDSAYNAETDKFISNLEDFMSQWVEIRGFPLITVYLSSDSEILVTRDHFVPDQQINEAAYQIPLTYTTSINMDFENIRPLQMLQNNLLITPDFLDGDEFILFNIQGQGYYRVNYDATLWERIIFCLNEPNCRERIHPLNRATLIDDALNLARADRLSYETAFQVVLTMEHETEYAPWKAYVRNMNFIKKRLIALVSEGENRDADIYMRMIRRIISGFENRVTFNPDPSESAMVSLTRGLVMDHACRVGYPNCIAAAIDFFYNPNGNDPIVNPNIPRDIRPAVYCTAVREGDVEVINALYQRLEIEPNHYERVVILESLGCSQNASFIQSLLVATIAETSPYGVEERSKIFVAVLESSYANARLANIFVNQNLNQIRNMYGGSQKMEELILALAENCANDVSTQSFRNLVNSNTLFLDDSMELAKSAVLLANENLIWDKVSLEDVYEWIDKNDSPKVIMSTMLLIGTVLVSIML